MDVTAEHNEASKLPVEKPKIPTPSRRANRIVNGVIAAGILAAGVGGALWGKDQLNHFLAPPSATAPSGELPKPPVVEPDKPASEKAINKVPLAELTKKQGFVSIVPFGGTITAEQPYGFSVSFQDLTIVDVTKGEKDKTMWVAVAMPGEKLDREDTGRSTINFDGTKTKEYIYKGFTAWILVTNNILVYPNGPGHGISQGINTVENSLKVGKTISFNASINQNEKNYQDMNWHSYQNLSKNLEKPNNDRSDQTFVFIANFANLAPAQ